MEEEIEFILTTAAQYLHKAPSRGDVLSMFAGIRPLVKAGATVLPEDRAGLIIEKLQKSNATKPRTVKTLSSMIASTFQKQITDEEVAAFFGVLVWGTRMLSRSKK